MSIAFFKYFLSALFILRFTIGIVKDSLKICSIHICILLRCLSIQPVFHWQYFQSYFLFIELKWARKQHTKQKLPNAKLRLCKWRWYERSGPLRRSADSHRPMIRRSKSVIKFVFHEPYAINMNDCSKLEIRLK